MNSIEDIQNTLLAMQDDAHKEFQCKLIPTVDPATVLGIRTPVLRKYAKTLIKEGAHTDFLHALPHRYYDENQLHALIISEIKDIDECLKELRRFLPYVDNWATCDQISPKVFKKQRQVLLDQIKVWICTDETYTVRFAIGMLMEHFLDEDFDPACPALVASVNSEEYYIDMMIAWYFATALAKQYDAVLPYLTDHRLDTWTHNKTIEKAVESYRITDEQKTHLKSLRIRKGKV